MDEMILWYAVIVELNEEDSCEKIIVRYYSKKEIHDIVRDRITDKLKEIIKYIENGNYQKIMKDLSESPAGDGYGRDNYYIDFSYVANDLISNDIEDIGTALEFLEALKNENDKRRRKKWLKLKKWQISTVLIML